MCAVADVYMDTRLPFGFWMTLEVPVPPGMCSVEGYLLVASEPC